ncbi:MAG: hypothetical protein H6702_15850 [Myxococcales bacterium]|nr:hypothetical protein [Myxococcales bacterium]
MRARRCRVDDRALLEALAHQLTEPDPLVEQVAQRLEALADLHPVGGILSHRGDRALIDALCAAWQQARARRDVPLKLQRLWQPCPQVGVALFPAVPAEGAGRVLAIRVGAALTPPEEADPDFKAVVSQAAQWVGRHVPGAEARIPALGWTVAAPPGPVHGQSVFLAACVAYTSAVLGVPAPAELAFTGCPVGQGASDERPRPVNPQTREGKLSACKRHAGVRALVAPTPEAWPQEPALPVLPVRRLRALLQQHFAVAWGRMAALAPAATPPPAEPLARTLVERSRAVLHAAAGPLTPGEVMAVIGQVWAEDQGHLRLQDLLEEDPAVVHTDEGRWLLALDRLDGQPVVDPVRADKVRAATLAWPEEDLSALTRAFEGLRDRSDRASYAQALATRGSLAARRLGLALRCLDGPAPLAALAPALVADADGPSLTLAVQAAAEVALYLAAAPVLDQIATTSGSPQANVLAKLEERPSLGRLAAAARAADPAPAFQAACDAVPKLLNAALHHPGGWAELAAWQRDAWGPGGDGRALLDHVTALLAPLRADAVDGRWIRQAGDGFTFYRGTVAGRERYWRFARGRAVAGDAAPWPNAALDRLPGPLAWLAIAAKKARGEGAWIPLVGALDALVALWLRLAVASGPSAHWQTSLDFTRITKRRLLERAVGRPLVADPAPLEAAVDGLERLEHHPGPVDGSFGALAQQVGADLFQALQGVERLSLWRGLADGPRCLQLAGACPTAPDGQGWVGPPLAPGRLAVRQGATVWPLWRGVAAPWEDGIQVLAQAGKARPRKRVDALESALYLQVAPGRCPRWALAARVQLPPT